MGLEKVNYLRSKKYRDGAEGEQCTHCGIRNGTIVGCHYTGIRQHQLGKGRGIKCTDLAIADLCHDCHIYFDQSGRRKSVEASEEFLFCILKTIIRREKQGLLTAR